MTSKERCLAAIQGRPVDRTPVFPLLMFLAADRAGITYRRYATHGPSLAQAQLMVRERFGVDAVTTCSDAFKMVLSRATPVERAALETYLYDSLRRYLERQTQGTIWGR